MSRRSTAAWLRAVVITAFSVMSLLPGSLNARAFGAAEERSASEQEATVASSLGEAIRRTDVRTVGRKARGQTATVVYLRSPLPADRAAASQPADFSQSEASPTPLRC